jgi:hypothetical protein
MVGGHGVLSKIAGEVGSIAMVRARSHFYSAGAGRIFCQVSQLNTGIKI